MICSTSGARPVLLPFAIRPMLIGMVSKARIIAWRFHGPGVMVTPLVLSVGPVPPPHRVVTPLLRAAYACSGVTRCTCVSMPPAVRMRCSPEMASVPGPVTNSGVTPSMMFGLPALPMPAILPSLTPTSALITPRVASTMVTFVMTRSRPPCALVYWLLTPMPSRRVLPPPYITSSPRTRRSFSISMYRSVSPSLIWSPVVGPYIPEYSCREIWLIESSLLPEAGSPAG